jgi:hypothetical protein
MPIVMFDNDMIYVIFPNTFVADTHEGWFDRSMWRRVYVESDMKVSVSDRGNAYRAPFSKVGVPDFIVKDL